MWKARSVKVPSPPLTSLVAVTLRSGVSGDVSKDGDGKAPSRVTTRARNSPPSPDKCRLFAASGTETTSSPKRIFLRLEIRRRPDAPISCIRLYRILKKHRQLSKVELDALRESTFIFVGFLSFPADSRAIRPRTIVMANEWRVRVSLEILACEGTFSNFYSTGRCTAETKRCCVSGGGEKVALIGGWRGRL